MQLDDNAWEKAINDEVELLLSQVNILELVKSASSLKGKKQCSFRPGKHLGSGAIMGCANYHAWIEFEDGEKWLVRIPRTGFSDIPESLIEYFVVSEFATLKFLEKTAVPAPKAYGYGLKSDPANSVGVSYIFMQALPGTPYQSYMASSEQKSRVLTQVADILVEIYKNPLPMAGSLLRKEGIIEVGPTASNRFLTLGLYGPFKTDLEYFASIVDQHLDLISDGQLYHLYPKEAFLFYQLLRQHIRELLIEQLKPENMFFLKHVDDKGDHLLIDENYNVTGIIDWQFARTVPACEAFGPSLMTAELNSLYSRNAGVNEDDRELSQALRNKGHASLARFAGGSELIRRFNIGLASGFDRNDVCEMILGVLATLNKNLTTIDIEDWVDKQWSQSQGDPRRDRIEALLSG